jgi:hypothetical protein
MIRLRVFRAVDDLASCQKFVEGHMKILKNFGITMITSANIEWFVDPGTYVLVAEELETMKILGGARIQVAGKKYPLPIEKAVTELDDSIHDVVKDYGSNGGTAELCGLWNSREIAGLGIGSVFLTRTAVCVAPSLGVKSMFALCAAYTIQMAQKTGFQIATFLGNNGTFYYPKDDLIATAMVLPDVNTLDTAHADEKTEILSLRENPNQIKTEEGRKGPFDLLYELAIQASHEM